MAEAALQKLKVTELKDLLSKHGLVQSGKKEDLVKRLLDNGITGEANGADAAPVVPVLADPSPIAIITAGAAGSEQAPAPVPVPAAAPAPASEPVVAANAANAETAQPEAEDELTEEEKKQKARAERFGVPWVRKKAAPAPAPKAAAAPATVPATTPAAAQPKEKKEKPGAIDKSAALGISEEVLARRAARFGPVEKKAPVTEAAAAATAPPAEKKEELSPEAAAKLAEEEERKRKRAEKFGVKPASSEAEPDAKKVKV